MDKSNDSYSRFASFVAKSKVIYKISSWYGIVCLVLAIISIPGLFVLYKAQGVSSADLLRVMSDNSFLSNLLWFANMTRDIFFNALIAFIPLSLIRGKSKMNIMTNYSAGMISVVACISVISVIVGVISFIDTQSLSETMAIMYQVKGFAYPLLPIVSLLAGVLFTVSYVNEKLDDSPRKYVKIILSSLALLAVLLSSIAKFFHIH